MLVRCLLVRIMVSVTPKETGRVAVPDVLHTFVSNYSGGELPWRYGTRPMATVGSTRYILVPIPTILQPTGRATGCACGVQSVRSRVNWPGPGIKHLLNTGREFKGTHRLWLMPGSKCCCLRQGKVRLVHGSVHRMLFQVRRTARFTHGIRDGPLYRRSKRTRFETFFLLWTSSNRYVRNLILDTVLDSSRSQGPPGRPTATGAENLL